MKLDPIKDGLVTLSVDHDRAELGLLDQEPPVIVEVRVADVRGVPQVVELSIRGTRTRAVPEIDRRGLTPEQADAAERLVAAVRKMVDEADLDPDPPVITAELLRRLPLRQLREAVLAHRRGSDPMNALHEPRKAGRGPKPVEHFEEVADLYRSAVADGSSPLLAIARRFGVGREAAKKYVRGARDRGLLGYPARPGQPGFTEAISPIRREERA